MPKAHQEKNLSAGAKGRRKTPWSKSSATLSGKEKTNKPLKKNSVHKDMVREETPRPQEEKGLKCFLIGK